MSEKRNVSITAYRYPKVIIKLIQAFIVLFLFTTPVFAQVLVVEPGCGKVGDTILITGSGWAAPDRVCEYIFFFNETEIAPRQPDGILGPPNANGAIPMSASAGEHTIRVEMRLLNGVLLQCRQTKFKVVEEVKNPLTVTMNKDRTKTGVTEPAVAGDEVAGERPSIRITFSPEDVCDVTPCSKIAFIQTVKMTGEKADKTIRKVTSTEIGYVNGDKHDKIVTDAGWDVDMLSFKNPYYQTDSRSGIFGVQGANPVTAFMRDAPKICDFSYPADIVKMIWDFQVAAFCAAGTNRGEFLGTVIWKWERPKGGIVTITTSAINRDQPSQELTDAVNLFYKNHGGSLPTKLPPATGEDKPCNISSSPPPPPPGKSFTFKCKKNLKSGFAGIERLIMEIGKDETCKTKLTHLEPNTEVEISTNLRSGFSSSIVVKPASGIADENGEIEFTITAIREGLDWVSWALKNDKGEFEFSKKSYDSGTAWGMFVEVEGGS